MLEGIDSPDTILDSLPDAAMIIDLETDRILTSNRAAERLLGFTPVDTPKFSTLIGQAVAQFVVFVDEVDHRGEAWT